MKLILILLIFLAGCASINTSLISDITCDALNKCPAGMECAKIEDLEPRCVDKSIDICKQILNCPLTCTVKEIFPPIYSCG